MRKTGRGAIRPIRSTMRRRRAVVREHGRWRRSSTCPDRGAMTASTPVRSSLAEREPGALGDDRLERVGLGGGHEQDLAADRGAEAADAIRDRRPAGPGGTRPRRSGRGRRPSERGRPRSPPWPRGSSSSTPYPCRASIRASFTAERREDDDRGAVLGRDVGGRRARVPSLVVTVTDSCGTPMSTAPRCGRCACSRRRTRSGRRRRR